jgi:hypothetical protein
LLTLVVTRVTAFFAELAFTLGASFGFGRGFANVLPRAAVLGDRVLVVVLAIDYPHLDFGILPIYDSCKYYRGLPDKSSPVVTLAFIPSQHRGVIDLISEPASWRPTGLVLFS